MTFVAFDGQRERDPEHILRIVRPDGTTLHVVEATPEKAEQIAQRTGGAVYEDCGQAVRDTLARSDIA
jgi:hypothetical protein